MTYRNEMVSFANSGGHITFDNFELLGLCEQTLGTASNHYAYGYDWYVVDTQIAPIHYENLYFHGWTHLKFSCSLDSTGEPVGICLRIETITGSSGNPSILGPGIVVDGSDSDPGGADAIQAESMYSMYDDVFRYNANICGGVCHSIHDNLIEYMYPSGDRLAHQNNFECITEAPGINVYYNNVTRHSHAYGVNWWIGTKGVTDYVFNNIHYDIISAGNFFNVEPVGNSTTYMFNNTLEDQHNGAVMDCEGGSRTYSINNHFITDWPTPYYGGKCITATDVFMHHSRAASQGYTSRRGGTCVNDATPCAPTSSRDATVGAGTNEESLCRILVGSSDPLVAAAGTACLSATTDGCTYNSTTHTNTCARVPVARPATGAWDVGAYQYTGQTVQSPTNPPATAQ
jgi:hypothetical protein